MHVPARRVTSVRADNRTGRLVRAAVVSPRSVAPRVIEPQAPAVEAAPAEATLPPGTPVNDMVEHIARRHEVEPVLVHSMMRVESNYNPRAVSPKGAEGLMQLMPGTARRFGVKNSFNPAQNIEGGVRYLKYLLELYGGDQRLALAAYNAGEGAVAKHGGIPPYQETRNYVYQVGKRLGQARTAQKQTPAREKESQPELPVIEKIIGADGKEYYRSR